MAFAILRIETIDFEISGNAGLLFFRPDLISSVSGLFNNFIIQNAASSQSLTKLVEMFLLVASLFHILTTTIAFALR